MPTNLKTITLTWPPTKRQVAWSLAIFYLLVANFILVPVGIMAEDGSDWKELAVTIVAIEVTVTMLWAGFILFD